MGERNNLKMEFTKESTSVGHRNVDKVIKEDPIDDIRQQIANQADSVRRIFESTMRKSSVSPATIAASRLMISKNKKRKIGEEPSTIRHKLSHFHSPIASLTRPVKRKGIEKCLSVNVVPNSNHRTLITLNSPPNELHVNYNDVVCGKGKITNDLVGNQRFRVWIDVHREVFVKARLEQDRQSIAHSIVNTIRRSVPNGRFLSLDIHSGIWYDVGDEKACHITMEALAARAGNDPVVMAAPTAMSPPRCNVQNTLASKAA